MTLIVAAGEVRETRTSLLDKQGRWSAQVFIRVYKP